MKSCAAGGFNMCSGSTLLQVLVCVPSAVDDSRAVHHLLLSAGSDAAPSNWQTMLVSCREDSQVVVVA